MVEVISLSDQDIADLGGASRADVERLMNGNRRMWLLRVVPAASPDDAAH
ncbi:MAG: hypothetical protein SF029_23860 [bacterium]|nr:hypothetical protein [bacterium]